jgi:nucleoside 2-deoxyribosyltransferase
MNSPSLSAYVGIKYHSDHRNRPLIEQLCSALLGAGISTRLVVRDIEEWGKVSMDPAQLMAETFQTIDSSDVVVIELSEKGVGLGIEAGYAFAVSIPIVVLHRSDTDVSSTLEGIAEAVIPYSNDSTFDEAAARVFEIGLSSPRT